MKGNVIGFDPDTNTGAISGFDGQRYDFVTADWRAQARPRHGDVVDFAPDGQRATQIYLLEPEYIRPGFGRFYFSPAGRISRSQYWLRGVLPIWILFLVGWILVAIVGAAGGHVVAGLLGLLLGLYSLAIIWPLIAIQVKRIHDRNKSGWLILIPIIPAVLITIFSAVAIAGAIASGITGGHEGLGMLIGAGAFSIILYVIQLIITIWFFIEFGCLRGTVGANNYGPDPVR